MYRSARYSFTKWRKKKLKILTCFQRFFFFTRLFVDDVSSGPVDAYALEKCLFNSTAKKKKMKNSIFFFTRYIRMYAAILHQRALSGQATIYSRLMAVPVVCGFIFMHRRICFIYSSINIDFGCCTQDAYGPGFSFSHSPPDCRKPNKILLMWSKFTANGEQDDEKLDASKCVCVCVEAFLLVGLSCSMAMLRVHHSNAISFPISTDSFYFRKSWCISSLFCLLRYTNSIHLLFLFFVSFS